MSTEETLQEILAPHEREKAVELDRFLRNLFVLFDGELPAHVQQHVIEILTVLEDQNREQFRKLLRQRKKALSA